MRPCALVVDTSYLWDLFGLPHRDPSETETERTERQNQMKKRFVAAYRSDSPVYVPYCVIFETANSIAHIEDNARRKLLSNALISSVESCIEKATPWVITPSEGTYLQKQDLLTLCQKFRHSSANKVGLTDIAIVHEAERLKYKYQFENRHVHIWTADRRLKEEQPDSEGAKCPAC